MRIHCLFVTRKGCDAHLYMPELLFAMDEYCMDANPGMYEEQCEKELASIGSDLDEYRHMVVKVTDDSIAEPFRAQAVNGIASHDTPTKG